MEYSPINPFFTDINLYFLTAVTCGFMLQRRRRQIPELTVCQDKKKNDDISFLVIQLKI